MGEHSPVDALVPSIVAEYAVVQGIDAAVQSSMLPVDAPTGGWERLEWVTDERIAQECVAAEQRVRAIVDDSDYSVLWFDAYGTEWIKNVGALFYISFVVCASLLMFILYCSWWVS